MKIVLGNETAPKGPLDGVRVLDLSTVVSGPLCAQVLGDLGAEVIKVEAPNGDATRKMGLPDASGFTGWYLQFNRNKRGVSLDLKTDGGREALCRMAREVDILIENYRPGVTERLEIDYARLKVDNPGLIYVSINGFGSDGPYRDLPAYDSVIQGISGFMHTQGGGGEPKLISSIAADKASGMTATWALLAALYARDKKGGSGQHIEIPMLDSWVAFILPDVIQDRTWRDAPEPGPTPSIHRTWETRDGHVVMMIVEDRQFHGICRALNRADLIDDPRCATLIDRFMNADTLFVEMEDEMRKWDTAEFVARCREFDAPVAPANSFGEVIKDPQVVHAGLFMNVDHPDAGALRLVKSPARFSENPVSFRAHPPKLGEHSDAVLREFGYSEEEIAAMRAEGSVH